MAQIVHQLRSEVMAHDFLFDAYKARGDADMVRKLEAAPSAWKVVSPPPGCGCATPPCTGLVWATPETSTRSSPASSFPSGECAYTLMDKINVWRAKLWSRPFFWDELLRDDLSTRLTRFELPVYFFVGRYDQTTNPTLSRAYFDAIDAPVKGFYEF